MARIARVVVPGHPHHTTQRGNRRQQTFFCDNDYVHYIELMSEWCKKYQVEIWGYCLMPNHIHMIAVPSTAESLGKAIGEAHRRYTRSIHFHKGWRGYLWQGRFSSYVMDERHLLAAARYIELNPVRAHLVTDAQGYRWSSARAHLQGLDDGLVKVEPLLDLVRDWREFLTINDSEWYDEIRKHQRTGRPLGGKAFLHKISDMVGRELEPKKAGRKKINEYRVP